MVRIIKKSFLNGNGKSSTNTTTNSITTNGINNVSTENNKKNTLKVIDCLRKVCNYPGLLLNDEDFSKFLSLKK